MLGYWVVDTFEIFLSKKLSAYKIKKLKYKIDYAQNLKYLYT